LGDGQRRGILPQFWVNIAIHHVEEIVDEEPSARIHGAAKSIPHAVEVVDFGDEGDDGGGVEEEEEGPEIAPADEPVPPPPAAQEGGEA
jgi:hypothetical protein